MAKKQKIEKVTHVEDTKVNDAPVVEQPKETMVMETPKPKKDNWEIKDRMYYLTKGRSPLTYLIRGSNIHWFDEEKGYERELKYTSNQRTMFVDEMKGDQRLEHIIFQNGNLFVPKNKTILQKLLSLYHPHRDLLFQ